MSCTRAPGFPDAADSTCCIGAAVYGPDGCTCWEPVHDVAQAEPRTDLPDGARTRMCTDCAYRPGSPERSGDEHAHSDAEDLERIVNTGEPFWCHQGMRRIASWRHPAGVTHVQPGAELAYDPPRIDGTPYRTDGTPGELCAGWLARRLRVEALRVEAAREAS